MFSSTQPQHGSALDRLRRAWYYDHIDDDTFFQLDWSDEETIAATLDRLQIDVGSTRTESDREEDDDDDDEQYVD